MKTWTLLSAVVVCVGCAATSSVHQTRQTTLGSGVLRDVMPCGVEEGLECDRRAILAMAGSYRVHFHFEETVLLQPGYSPRPTKDSDATELVLVVSDEPQRIELQHILMGGPHIIKHWRQVWEYEAPTHFVFAGDQRFEPKARTEEERRGTWTQSVYEVSDAPRYAGLGKWNHRYGVSTWTSERTWRPLPRREYTTRSDYQLLNVENRHTVTPLGWTHEQDNTKVIRSEGARDLPLVREFGFNEYVRIADPLPKVQSYWEQTAPFWAAVRARWQARLSAGPVKLSYPVNEEKKVLEVLLRAELFRKSPDLEATNTWLDEMFAGAVVSETPADVP